MAEGRAPCWVRGQGERPALLLALCSVMVSKQAAKKSQLHPGQKERIINWKTGFNHGLAALTIPTHPSPLKSVSQGDFSKVSAQHAEVLGS